MAALCERIYSDVLKVCLLFQFVGHYELIHSLRTREHQ